MKRIRLCVQDIRLRGRDPGVLTDLVLAINKQLQIMCERTDGIRMFLLKFSANFDGKQLARAIEATAELSKKLNEACEIIYDTQVQVVDYQNKVYRFEGGGETAAPPRPSITEIRISADCSQINYTISDLKNLADKLAEYCDSIYESLKKTEVERDKIASVWLDSQYKDFSNIIDDVISNMNPHLAVLEDYIVYLDNKIMEISG